MNRGVLQEHNKDFKNVPFPRVFSKVLLANRRLICKATSSYQNRHKKSCLYRGLHCIYFE